MFIEPFLIFLSTLVQLNDSQQNTAEQTRRPEPKVFKAKEKRQTRDHRGGWDYN